MRSGLSKSFQFVLAIALFVISNNILAQRYYGNPRGQQNYYHSSMGNVYPPRPMIRPSLSINFGFKNGFETPYNTYNHLYIPYGPSIGFNVNTLPYGYYPFSFGRDNYYYHNNTFYKRNGNRNYEVVNPPLGAKLPELPRDAKTVIIDGNRYYELGGTYYQETYNSNNNVLYEVVGVNGKLFTNPNNLYNNNQGYNNQNNINLNEGDIVERLPEQCRIVTVNGQTLYVSPDNIYYQKETNIRGTFYRIVGK